MRVREREREEREVVCECECECKVCVPRLGVYTKRKAHLLLPALARITGTRSPLPLVVRNSGSGHEGREECCASDRCPLCETGYRSFLVIATKGGGTSYRRAIHKASTTARLPSSCTYKALVFAEPPRLVSSLAKESARSKKCPRGGKAQTSPNAMMGGYRPVTPYAQGSSRRRC
ncbi:hypothetical protein J3E69DRAFT_323773 [Trichoderma sp. SZMC 28015]